MTSATIKLFIPRGDAKSLRTAEISNWTGKAVAAPRTELDELLAREELEKAGIYILTGSDPTTNAPRAYIGEAEVIRERLRQHKSKEFWVSAIVFVSKDENLTKAHVRYLESRLLSEAARVNNLKTTPAYYQGVLDGSTPTGNIIHTGAAEGFNTPPTVAADPNRRSLLRTEWIQEFFNTSTDPVGHGFDLVDPSQPDGFACYSFLPQPDVPLKVIVLDDTQSETDGSTDIHGHGYLDANRWAWLQAELAAGQAANQLMIIAAHIPIGVSNIGSETEWWESDKDSNATEQNAVSLTDLVATLQNTPNLLMWIAGHRHLNTVKAFASPDPVNAPEKGFWQVETSSLRDHPQQFRTFEIYLNSDYSVSIIATNVDPAVAGGTPAATSRYYSIATQQIIQTNLKQNNYNVDMVNGIPVETMDPSRPQDGSPDPSIKYGSVPGVPYCASYNAELFKQLSPTMISVLQAQFPTNG